MGDKFVSLGVGTVGQEYCISLFAIEIEMGVTVL